MSASLIIGYVLFIIPIIIVIAMIATAFYHHNRNLPLPIGYQWSVYFGVIISFILLLFSLIFLMKGMTCNAIKEYHCMREYCDKKKIEEPIKEVKKIEEPVKEIKEEFKSQTITKPQPTTEIIKTSSDDIQLEPKLVYIMTPKNKPKTSEEYSCLLI